MTLQRAPLTDWINNLVSEQALTGDVLAPAGGGWDKAKENFTPYVVISPTPGQVRDQAQGAPWDSWQLSYQLTFYGVSRGQVERLADEVRAALLSKKAALRAQPVGKGVVRDMSCTSIGAVAYTTQLDPYGYSQTDSYAIDAEIR